MNRYLSTAGNKSGVIRIVDLYSIPKIVAVLMLFCILSSCETGSSNGRKEVAHAVSATSPFEVSTGTDSSDWGGNDPRQWPATFGIGKTAQASDIERMDLDIMPDGRGLPAGSGTAASGQSVYMLKCAACHGAGGREGPNNKLVSLPGDTSREKTIGNYWPYATTIFDYVRRAMPYNAPGSLSDAEVYNLTAYLLFANKLIDSNTVIDARTLPLVNMPAKKYFVNDDRRGGAEVR